MKKSNKEWDETTKKLLEALEESLLIIMGEYPKQDDRYMWAKRQCDIFGIDLEEF